MCNILPNPSNMSNDINTQVQLEELKKENLKKEEMLLHSHLIRTIANLYERTLTENVSITCEVLVRYGNGDQWKTITINSTPYMTKYGKIEYDDDYEDIIAIRNVEIIKIKRNIKGKIKKMFFL